MITIVAQGKFHSENIAKVLKKKKIINKIYTVLLFKTDKQNTKKKYILYKFIVFIL